MTPFISLIIPARNEAETLDACLKSLLIDGTYPTDRMEVVIVDGQSSDATRDIAERWAKRFPIAIIDNPKRSIPVAMNLGIKATTGEFIFKIDAHSTYDANYLARCINHHRLRSVDNVGGIFIHTARNETPTAEAIATVMGHPLGGGADFRVGIPKPTFSETAAYGCYRREVFERVGMYDERLTRSSDMDLNNRIRAAGGKILLCPDVHVLYRPPGTLKDFLVRTYQDGVWATYPLAFGSRFQQWRHYAPLAAFLIAVACIAVAPKEAFALAVAYLLVIGSIGFRHTSSVREFLIFPVVFAIRHFVYGFGSLVGLFKVMPMRLGIGK